MDLPVDGRAGGRGLVTPDEITRLRKGDRNAKQHGRGGQGEPQARHAGKEAPKPKPAAAVAAPAATTAGA